MSRDLVLSLLSGTTQLLSVLGYKYSQYNKHCRRREKPSLNARLQHNAQVLQMTRNSYCTLHVSRRLKKEIV